MTSRGTAKVSQEPENQVEQQTSGAEGELAATPTPSSESASTTIQRANDDEQQVVVKVGKKRVKRKTRLVSVEDVMPRPSFWPILVAFSLAVVLFGILAGPIFLGIGAVLVIVSIIGWVLERR